MQLNFSDQPNRAEFYYTVSKKSLTNKKIKFGIFFIFWLELLNEVPVAMKTPELKK